MNPAANLLDMRLDFLDHPRFDGSIYSIPWSYHMNVLSHEQLKEAVDVWERCGRNTTRAAEVLDIARSTMGNRLAQAGARNIGGDLLGKQPPGHLVKGVSTLYSEDGQAKAQWIKSVVERPTVDDIIDAAREVFEGYKGWDPLPPAPKWTADDLVTFYNVADLHLGMYSWKEETGNDYDADIAGALLLSSMQDLVASSPASTQAVVLGLGDYFHSDSDENRTRRSGAALDVDTRYARVLRIGVQLFVECVQMALQKHGKVLVRILPGNHDPYASLALSIALDAFFNNDNRVTVDCSPEPHFWWTFGKVFIGATHGDTIKPEAMPGVMASLRPKDWGASNFRYAYFGHVHTKHKGGGEQHGVIWESFQTLAVKDAWHHSQGYSAGRSMTSITHHKDRGEVLRQTVAVLPKED